MDFNGTSYAEGVVPRIHQVAIDMGLPLIDAYTPLINHPEYFPDGVHPNMEGAQIIANIIYKAIKSNSESYPISFFKTGTFPINKTNPSVMKNVNAASQWNFNDWV